MQILWLDAFHGGSHAAVAQGYAGHSRHQVDLLTMSIAGGWRWRMRGAAVSLARMVRDYSRRPDLLIATDMLDLATFRALTADRLGNIPALVYFHENQLTYPLPPGRSRDLSFAWINYTSALVADGLLFNSAFHRREFLQALPGLLGRYHDYRELHTIEQIMAKASVLPPGIEMRTLQTMTGSAHPAIAQPPAMRSETLAHVPILLWNSRWEYDKQPDRFFAALVELERRGVAFRLIIAGEHIDPRLAEFVAARERWADRIEHWGYVPSRSAYIELLQRADIVVSTALQEFFGIGVIEALACGCVPVLPRRLSYPELLPARYHATCLYNDDQDLIERLAMVIEHLDQLQANDWPAIAAPYDWARLAPRYDAFCEQIVYKSVPDS